MNIPIIKLAFKPTPIEKLINLSTCLNGPTIYIKRDDQTGLAFGGNKTRKLEVLIADAIYSHSTSLITSGSMQSNHCRQTAAAAAKLGLECHLVLKGEQPKNINGNLLLNNLFGANIHWTGKNSNEQKVNEIIEKLSKEIKKPYIIPYGGSNSIGLLGYVKAMEELKKQLDNYNLMPDHIVFASSSGGTQAGIVLGSKIHGITSKVTGISIDDNLMYDMELKDYMVKISNEAANRFNLEYKLTTDNFNLNTDYHGKGYGIVSDLEKNAISIMAKKEGIILDPVYTSRAMGGLIDLIDNGHFKKEDKILFWHTGGGPSLFDYSEDFV